MRIDISLEIKRELSEELNIAPPEFEKALVQGVGYDPIHCHPELFVVAYLQKTSEAISRDWLRARNVSRIMRHEKQ